MLLTLQWKTSTVTLLTTALSPSLTGPAGKLVTMSLSLYIITSLISKELHGQHLAYSFSCVHTCMWIK